MILRVYDTLSRQFPVTVRHLIPGQNRFL